MRKADPKELLEKKRLLRSLEEDWPQMSRPHINKDLRMSLHTRILELRSEIEVLEANCKRQERQAQKKATSKL